jgi:hypothetical protein
MQKTSSHTERPQVRVAADKKQIPMESTRMKSNRITSTAVSSLPFKIPAFAACLSLQQGEKYESGQGELNKQTQLKSAFQCNSRVSQRKARLATNRRVTHPGPLRFKIAGSGRPAFPLKLPRGSCNLPNRRKIVGNLFAKWRIPVNIVHRSEILFYHRCVRL